MFISIPFIVYSIYSQKKMLLESLEIEVKNINKLIIFALSDTLILNDNSSIVEFLTEYIKDNEKLENIIISKEDNSYIVIKKDAWSFESKIDKSYKDLEKEKDVFLLLKSVILNNKEVFHYSTPISFSGVHLGWIHLSMSLDEYKSRLLSVFLGFYSFFGVLFLLFLIISYLLSRSISNPIVALNNIVSKISEGDLKLRTNYKSNDELGTLAQSFNVMISAIEDTQTQLKQSHEKLEDRVEERTKELDSTNKLLEVKTFELEKLNKTLDNKIKEEIGKRIQQESILIQQSRLAATGEMIGNIAHQWRQPLSLITTCASGIKLEKEFGISTEDTELEKLNTIIQSSNYLSKTIDDFRNFFKPNKEKKYFSIEEMTEQSIRLVNASFNFHFIKINKNYNQIQKVYGFPNEFSQAILNILSNAKDALSEKNIESPFINIEIYENEEYGFLGIEDNAQGISEDILTKIFDPYFTTKHKTQGTGIGLYMSKMIIEKNMNGSLTVENTKNGAKFIFVIPKK
ncbi:MAG: ATP-binding protein [Aliarcobacter sp.]|jgi:signal transduction histidine kinase|nr:ATP-binding protein [Aliarcobacter sp.]